MKKSSVVETTAAAASAQLVATLAWLSGLQSIEHCFPFPFLSNSLNPTTDDDDCPGSGSGEQMVMLLERFPWTTLPFEREREGIEREKSGT